MNVRDADTALFGTSERKRSHRNNTELGMDRVRSWTLNSVGSDPVIGLYLTTYGLMKAGYLPQ